MLQNTSEQDKQLNIEDVIFANTNAPRIHDEWKTKFLAGAAEHGGIGKPSLVERNGLIREALCEHYDGISYILAIEKRVKLAQAKLMLLLSNSESDFLTTIQTRTLMQVIELLS